MTSIQERQASISQVRVWAEQKRLFAIVDATDTPAVPIKVREVGDSAAVSLYKGRAEEGLFAIAPYLFRVDLEILDWITGDLWAGPWGILVLAEGPLDDLRRHFRRFLVVEAPNGESWYFRFYDPRVLAAYLPTCNDAELAEFFGPVRAFGVTDPATYAVKVLAVGASPAPHGIAKTQPIVIRR